MAKGNAKKIGYKRVTRCPISDSFRQYRPRNNTQYCQSTAHLHRCDIKLLHSKCMSALLSEIKYRLNKETKE